MTQEVTPSQAARDAAAEFMDECAPYLGDCGMKNSVHLALRQVFARFEEQTRTVTEREVVVLGGSSCCPVCYDDKPHTHNAIEAVEMRGLEFPATNEAWLRYVGRTLDAALINELDFLFKKARRALSEHKS